MTEEHLACRNLAQVSDSGVVHLAAHDDCAQKCAIHRRVCVIRLPYHLIKTLATEPPTRFSTLFQRAPEQFLCGCRGKCRSRGAQGDYLAFAIRKNKQVAVVRLPRVFAGIPDGAGFPVSYVRHDCQQVRFAAEGYLLLLLHYPEG